MRTPLKTFIGLLCALWLTACADSRQAYLFTYFTGEGDGLRLAYSYDGKRWTPLTEDTVLLKPSVGADKLMRDPSVARGKDGTFHLVWTSGWHDRFIGYASTRDFVTWSEQRQIPVMEHQPGTRNCWAPELFYDERQDLFYIFWASTVPGQHSYVPTSDEETGWNHRIYFTTTRDFETFAPVEMMLNTDFSAIDAAIVEDRAHSRYLMVVKNENSAPAEKNIRVTRTDDLRRGFPTTVSAPITGDYWAEGPAPLFVGDTLYVYFDMYTQGRYGAVRSLDYGDTWQDVSDSVSFPLRMRHGTAIAVPHQFVEQLKEQLGKQHRD